MGNDCRLHFLAVRFRHELADGALVGFGGEDSRRIYCAAMPHCFDNVRRTHPNPLVNGL